MAIEGIIAGAYSSTAARVSKEPAYVETASVKQSQSSTTGVPAAPAPVVVYKEQEAGNSQGDAASKNSEEAARQIRATVAEANFKATRTRCEYSVDEKTNRISIKMIDEQTDEVIKEIPPEKSLEMLAKVWELAGILVDEKR